MTRRFHRKNSAILTIQGDSIYSNSIPNHSSDEFIFYDLITRKYRPQHVIVCREWRTFTEYRDYVNSHFPGVDVQVLLQLWSDTRSWIASVDIIRSFFHNKLISATAADHLLAFSFHLHNWPPLIHLSASCSNINPTFSESDQNDKCSEDDSWAVVEHDSTTLDWELVVIPDEGIDENKDSLDHYVEDIKIVAKEMPSSKLSYKDTLLKKKFEGNTMQKSLSVPDNTVKRFRVPWNPLIVVIEVNNRKLEVYKSTTISGKIFDYKNFIISIIKLFCIQIVTK